MRRKLASLVLEEDMVKKSLWVLAIVLIGAAIACTLDNPDAPELAGPSTLGRSVEVHAKPDQLISDGFSSSVIEAKLRGPNSEGIPGAEIYFDIQGFVDLGNLTPLNQQQPPSVLGAPEATAVFDTTDAGGVARARYWAPFRTDQPRDTVVTILARETKTNFRQDVFGKADIFLRAADRPIPGPIPVPEPGCDPPTAVLELSGLCEGGEIKSRRAIRAIGAASTAEEPGATIVTFVYDWGDGSRDISGSSSQSHTYSSSLNGFSTTISLTVVNSCGASATDTESGLLIVATCVPPPPPPPPPICTPPTAAFTASLTCSPAGEILADGTSGTLFDGSTSTSDPLFPITSYSWSFGDTTTGVGVVPPVHIYQLVPPVGALFTVNLTVTNSCGATDTEATSFTAVPTCP